MKNILKEVIEKWKTEINIYFEDVYLQHRKAYESLKNNNEALLKEVFLEEKKINKKYNNFIKNGLYDLAQYHFLASHLRRFFSYLNIASELERISDFNKDICKLNQNKTLNQEEKDLLLIYWEKLLNHFDEVQKIFKEKDLKTLITFFKNHKDKPIISLDDLNKKINALYQDKTLKWSISKFYFLKQFQNLERCEKHLMNIVEYLILIRDFPAFKVIQNRN